VRHAQPPRTSTSPPPVTRYSPQHTPLHTTHTAGNPHTSVNTSTGGHPLHDGTGCGRPQVDVRRQPRVSPQWWQATRRSANCELLPCTGKGAIDGAGPPRSATRPAAGRAREPPRSSQPRQHNPTTRPPPTTTEWLEARVLRSQPIDGPSDGPIDGLGPESLLRLPLLMLLSQQQDPV
jgi:hypothetical protein